MVRLNDRFRNLFLRRSLLAEGMIVLAAVREKHPARPKDRILFVMEPKPLLSVHRSALIQVWGIGGIGPRVHITNLAGFLNQGMSLADIKESQI
jgi:hypothetical protein